MPLQQHHIDELKAIYLKESGIAVDDKEAWGMAIRLINLFRILTNPDVDFAAPPLAGSIGKPGGRLPHLPAGRRQAGGRIVPSPTGPRSALSSRAVRQAHAVTSGAAAGTRTVGDHCENP